MRIYLDTKFIEDGRTIGLLSIGMVRQDGEAKYLVVQDDNAVHRAVQDPWLRENVMRHLPVQVFEPEDEANPVHWVWDGGHPDFRHCVWKPATVRRVVHEFISETPDPQLWAWYSAYDHVAYAQLFGRMIDLPKGFPMATFDVKQEAARMGVSDGQLHAAVPDPGNVHNALHDAMWAAAAHEWLIETERQHYRNTFATPYGWDR